jgi:Kef-type K+ transport system membrane component KefB
MTTGIIITICVLVLLAYVFDITSGRTRIPSVILLLLLGWGVRQLAGLFDIYIPDLSPVLPILGTLGLILIVLEGSLELEFNKSKFKLIGKSFIVALLPMLALGFASAWVIQQLGHYSLKDSLANVIPLCVISSAIAIPSARNLSAHQKEFIIYESSLSDILGVVFFNFVVLNSAIGAHSFGMFFLQLLIMIVISFVATAGLSFLLSKIEHHIKFVPIILLIILIEVISKEFQLPSLIFILVLGLFLGNLDEIKQFKWMQKLKATELDKEVHKFRELTVEATFLIKTLFFLLFGYLIDSADLLNTETIILSIGIVLVVFIIRALILKLTGSTLKPLLFIAPRGLITILLFLSLPAAQHISIINKSVVIQVIILTALIMMFGLMTSKKEAVVPVEEVVS